MRYMILMHFAESAGAELSEEQMAEGRQAMSAYADTLQRAEVLLGANVLHPSSSTTTLTAVSGELRIQDGPFADTKEQLAGTFLIDVDDLDAAVEWARQAPPVNWGSVEVRPVATYTVDGQWTPNS